MKTTVENTVNLFNDQEFYIGLDVHKKNFKVQIRNQGRELKRFSMDPEPEKLKQYLRKNYPGGKYNSVYEAGFCGYWIHRNLMEAGINNIVINPADVPTKQKERTHKTDKVDSKKLARELENGSLEKIYIPTKEEEALRTISRLRFQIVKDQTRTKNRIISFLDLHGIRLPENTEEKHWSKKFIDKIKKLEFREAYNKTYKDKLIEELEHQRSRNLEILRLIRKIGREIEIIDYLITVPGIGIIIAFTLYAELFNMSRFKKVDEVASIVGLVPSVSESDETKYNLGLTYRYNKYLRSLLVEAAWISVRKDPALTASFNEYCKRMSKQKAIIKVARKLLNRIRYVWLNKKEYVTGVIQ
jgi:transposase